MKTMFIPARKKNLIFEKELLKKLKLKKPDIFYTIQYEKVAKEIKKHLKIKTSIQQVLGCSIIKSKNNVLLITDGKFHALNIAVNSNKEIYIFDGHKIEKITKQEIGGYLKIRKGKISLFLSSNEIGLVVSTKKYQNKLEEALILKEKIEKTNKKVFIFICDNVNIEELENFSLPVYINTACPGLDKDNRKILNYIDILPYLKK